MWSRSGNPYWDYATNSARVGVPLLAGSAYVMSGSDEAQQVTDDDGRIYFTGDVPQRARKLGDLDAPYVAMQERIRRLRQQQ